MCKLTDVTPDTVIDRFMNDLGQEIWKRRENDAVRQTLVDYFVLCGYGQKWYTEQEIRQMFRELDAIGSLWPENDPARLARFNQLLREAAARYPSKATVVDLKAFVCPGGKYVATLDGYLIRSSDGIHFPHDAIPPVAAKVLPALRSIAANAKAGKS